VFAVCGTVWCRFVGVILCRVWECFVWVREIDFVL